MIGKNIQHFRLYVLKYKVLINKPQWNFKFHSSSKHVTLGLQWEIFARHLLKCISKQNKVLEKNTLNSRNTAKQIKSYNIIDWIRLKVWKKAWYNGLNHLGDIYRYIYKGIKLQILFKKFHLIWPEVYSSNS